MIPIKTPYLPIVLAGQNNLPGLLLYRTSVPPRLENRCPLPSRGHHPRGHGAPSQPPSEDRRHEEPRSSQHCKDRPHPFTPGTEPLLLCPRCVGGPILDVSQFLHNLPVHPARRTCLSIRLPFGLYARDVQGASKGRFDTNYLRKLIHAGYNAMGRRQPWKQARPGIGAVDQDLRKDGAHRSIPMDPGIPRSGRVRSETLISLATTCLMVGFSAVDPPLDESHGVS